METSPQTQLFYYVTKCRRIIPKFRTVGGAMQIIPLHPNSRIYIWIPSDGIWCRYGQHQCIETMASMLEALEPNKIWWARCQGHTPVTLSMVPILYKTITASLYHPLLIPSAKYAPVSAHFYMSRNPTLYHPIPVPCPSCTLVAIFYRTPTMYHPILIPTANYHQRPFSIEQNPQPYTIQCQLYVQVRPWCPLSIEVQPQPYTTQDLNHLLITVSTYFLWGQSPNLMPPNSRAK